MNVGPTPEPTAGPRSRRWGRGLRRSSLLFLLSTYASLATGIISGPILARSLGPSGVGLTAELSVLGLLLAFLFTFGLDVTIAHDAARIPAERGALLGSCLRILAVTMPVVLGSAALLMVGPLGSVSGEERVLAALLLGLTSFNSLTLCLQAFLLAESAVGSLGILRMVSVALSGVGSVVMYALGELTLTHYLALASAGVLVVAAGSWRAAGVRPKGVAPIRPMLSFGLRGLVGSILSFTNTSLDQPFVGSVLGRTSLGYYAVAVAVASLPQVLAQAVAFRAFGSIGAAFRSGDRGKVGEPMRVATIMGVTGASGLAVLGPVLLPVLYGHRFERSATLILILLPGSVAWAAATPAVSALLAIGRPGTGSVAQVAGIIVMATGLPIALNADSLPAVALVSTLSYATVAAVSMQQLRRLGVRPLLPRYPDAKIVLSYGLAFISRGGG